MLEFVSVDEDSRLLFDCFQVTQMLQQDAWVLETFDQAMCPKFAIIIAMF